jgi:hypothetical protein
MLRNLAWESAIFFDQSVLAVFPALPSATFIHADNDVDLRAKFKRTHGGMPFVGETYVEDFQNSADTSA